VLAEWVNGSETVQYLWSPVYVDSLILRDSGGNRIYVQQDANYNTTSLIDNTGAVLERYIYDPYGAPTVLNPDWSLDADGTDFSFVYLHQGGRHDSTLELSHFRNRDLHVDLGRWTRQDPLGFVDGSNVYQGYVSSPVNGVDPDGLQATTQPAPNDPPDSVEVDPDLVIVAIGDDTDDPVKRAANWDGRKTKSGKTIKARSAQSVQQIVDIINRTKGTNLTIVIEAHGGDEDDPVRIGPEDEPLIPANPEDSSPLDGVPDDKVGTVYVTGCGAASNEVKRRKLKDLASRLLATVFAGTTPLVSMGASATDDPQGNIVVPIMSCDNPKPGDGIVEIKP
jgi:RHS repeat-associated protein